MAEYWFPPYPVPQLAVCEEVSVWLTWLWERWAQSTVSKSWP